MSEKYETATTVVSYSGPGLGTIVFIVFLILKLTGAANIPWFWVFFPLWIMPAVIFGLFLLAAIISGIILLFITIFGDHD